MKNTCAFTFLMAALLGSSAFLITRAIQSEIGSRTFQYRVASLERDTRANLAWMRQKLSLTDVEFDQECLLHDAYMTEHKRLCEQMNVAREILKRALNDESELSEEGQAAIRDYERHHEACELAVIRHVKLAAAAMNPEAGREYIKLMLHQLIPNHDMATNAAVTTR